MGVHCGIYKSSLNISNVIFEFTPSTILPYPPSPIPGIVSTGSHFSFYIHVYTVFAPYSPSHTLSPPPPLSHWYQPQAGSVPHSCSSVYNTVDLQQICELGEVDPIYL
jgi:hypothetical protein